MSRPAGVGIVPGARVAYARTFLRSVGGFTGPLPHARGVVTNLVPLGRDTVLAVVQWSRAAGVPDKVNVMNLVRVDHLHLEER
jgi:hypothetical protein